KAAIIEFSKKEKAIYQNFAKKLIETFADFYTNCEYRSDITTIIRRLENVYNDSVLEEHVQNIAKLTRCFLEGRYRYFSNKEFPVEILKEFLFFFRSIPVEKQKIVLNNIWQRFDTVKRVEFTADDLPF